MKNKNVDQSQTLKDLQEYLDRMAGRYIGENHRTSGETERVLQAFLDELTGKRSEPHIRASLNLYRASRKTLGKLWT